MAPAALTYTFPTNDAPTAATFVEKLAPYWREPYVFFPTASPPAIGAAVRVAFSLGNNDDALISSLHTHMRHQDDVAKAHFTAEVSGTVVWTYSASTLPVNKQAGMGLLIDSFSLPSSISTAQLRRHAAAGRYVDVPGQALALVWQDMQEQRLLGEDKPAPAFTAPAMTPRHPAILDEESSTNVVTPPPSPASPPSAATVASVLPQPAPATVSSSSLSASLHTQSNDTHSASAEPAPPKDAPSVGEHNTRHNARHDVRDDIRHDAQDAVSDNSKHNDKNDDQQIEDGSTDWTEATAVSRQRPTGMPEALLTHEATQDPDSLQASLSSSAAATIGSPWDTSMAFAPSLLPPQDSALASDIGDPIDDDFRPLPEPTPWPQIPEDEPISPHFVGTALSVSPTDGALYRERLVWPQQGTKRAAEHVERVSRHTLEPSAPSKTPAAPQAAANHKFAASTSASPALQAAKFVSNFDELFDDDESDEPLAEKAPTKASAAPKTTSAAETKRDTPRDTPRDPSRQSSPIPAQASPIPQYTPSSAAFIPPLPPRPAPTPAPMPVPAAVAAASAQTATASSFAASAVPAVQSAPAPILSTEASGAESTSLSIAPPNKKPLTASISPAVPTSLPVPPANPTTAVASAEADVFASAPTQARLPATLSAAQTQQNTSRSNAPITSVLHITLEAQDSIDDEPMRGTHSDWSSLLSDEQLRSVSNPSKPILSPAPVATPQRPAAAPAQPTAIAANPDDSTTNISAVHAAPPDLALISGVSSDVASNTGTNLHQIDAEAEAARTAARVQLAGVDALDSLLEDALDSMLCVDPAPASSPPAPKPPTPARPETTAVVAIPASLLASESRSGAHSDLSSGLSSHSSSSISSALSSEISSQYSADASSEYDSIPSASASVLDVGNSMLSMIAAEDEDEDLEDADTIGAIRVPPKATTPPPEVSLRTMTRNLPIASPMRDLMGTAMRAVPQNHDATKPPTTPLSQSSSFGREIPADIPDLHVDAAADMVKISSWPRVVDKNPELLRDPLLMRITDLDAKDIKPHLHQSSPPKDVPSIVVEDLPAWVVDETIRPQQRRHERQQEHNKHPRPVDLGGEATLSQVPSIPPGVMPAPHAPLPMHMLDVSRPLPPAPKTTKTSFPLAPPAPLPMGTTYPDDETDVELPMLKPPTVRPAAAPKRSLPAMPVVQHRPVATPASAPTGSQTYNGFPAMPPTLYPPPQDQVPVASKPLTTSNLPAVQVAAQVSAQVPAQGSAPVPTAIPTFTPTASQAAFPAVQVPPKAMSSTVGMPAINPIGMQAEPISMESSPVLMRDEKEQDAPKKGGLLNGIKKLFQK